MNPEKRIFCIGPAKIVYWWAVVLAHAAIVLILVLLAKSKPARFVHLHYIMRCWYLIWVILCSYKELTYLVPKISPRDLDLQLAAIDRWMFGVDPTIWFERITHPLLTEILQICYCCYYLFPLILAIILWRKRRFKQVHFFLFIVAAGFYLSYIGYITVPAIGPRFILEKVYSAPLSGIFSYQALRNALDYMEGITRDCFPSGHTELTLLVLYCARRYHKPSFRVMLVPGIALVFSTVYLRYHYVIDVIAGAALAFAIMALADRVYKSLGGGDPEDSGVSLPAGS